MNYLAHGYRYLDRPLFLAGTAVPDWLSVVDRHVRARSRLVLPVVEQTDNPIVKEVGRGILQHHQDDDRFHRSEVFQRLEGELGNRFRTVMPDPYDHRPGFLGHIVVELLLDAWLAETNSDLLPAYYDAMAKVPAQQVEVSVNQMATRTTNQLAWFIDRFRDERFLFDYLDNQRLLLRLNQVMKRVRLPRLEPSVVDVLQEARWMVAGEAPQLLNLQTF
ncbi:MAG: hypothetical protein R3C49_14345 [Planctomycetaceae bacterium]